MKQFQIVQDKEIMAEVAANYIFSAFQKSQKFILGVATGSTPKKVYEVLAKKFRETSADLSKMFCVQLDEYLGLGLKDSRSFAAYIQKYIVKPWGLKKSQILFWDGDCQNPAGEVDRFNSILSHLGGIDCQILGLGLNGHIGFNEPGSLKESRCREVVLTQETLQNNKEDLAGGKIPTDALTMGIADILKTKNILLLVSGNHKQKSFERFLKEEPSPQFPATFLKGHADLVVMVDKSALSDSR